MFAYIVDFNTYKQTDILLDKVAISGDDKYIVAVTDKNTVVIWTKTPNQWCGSSSVSNVY